MPSRIHGLIMALGGVECVAHHFGLTPQAVRDWVARDAVPRRRQVPLLVLALQTEVVTGHVINWRPDGWDPRLQIRYEGRGARAA